jgi:uncharacterized repeat protein (TIGR04138 family)
MPPTDQPVHAKALQTVVEEVDCYPIDAFQFVQQGLGYAVEKFHGGITDPSANRHISGQQLCEGLREYALLKWGLLARTVLRHWNINSTMDFGQIVFAMVNSGLLQKTDGDTIEDFRNVFDFKTAFEVGYRISLEQLSEKPKEARL